MPDEVHELVMIESAVRKLGARGISKAEALQLPANLNTKTRNAARSEAERRLLIGKTDGGRVLTLVIEQTLEPGTWLVITGWTAATHEQEGSSPLLPQTPDGGGHTSPRVGLGLALGTTKGCGLRPREARSGARQPRT